MFLFVNKQLCYSRQNKNFSILTLCLPFSFYMFCDTLIYFFIRYLVFVYIFFIFFLGFKANRDIFMGTWFINKICEVFMENAKHMHVEELFRLVDLKLAQLRSEEGLHQTSMYENRGFRPLYLSPGLDDLTENSNNNHQTTSEANSPNL